MEGLGRGVDAGPPRARAGLAPDEGGAAVNTSAPAIAWLVTWCAAAVAYGDAGALLAYGPGALLDGVLVCAVLAWRVARGSA